MIDFNFSNCVRAKITIEPKPAPRPRMGRNGTVYYNDWYDQYRSFIARQCAMQFGGIFIEKPLELNLTFIRKINPESRRFGDADNLAKGVMDSLIGVLYPDDSLIVRLTVSKHKTDDPTAQGVSIVAFF